MPLLLLLLAAGWLAQLQLQRWHTFTAPNPKAAATFYAKCNAHEIIYRLMTCCSNIQKLYICFTEVWIQIRGINFLYDIQNFKKSSYR